MNKVKEFMDNCPSAELWLDENEDKWTRDVVDKTINNKKYVPFIISFEDYFMARGEKELRCRYDRNLAY